MKSTTPAIKERSSDYERAFQVPRDDKIRDYAWEGVGVGSGFESVKFQTGVLADLDHKLNIKHTKRCGRKAIMVELKINRPDKEKYKVVGGRLEFIFKEEGIPSSSMKIGLKRRFGYAGHNFGDSVYYPGEEGNQSINLIKLSFTVVQYGRPDFSSAEFFLRRKPDLTVICGEESWLVHKTVLIEQSSVFRQMFATEMRESASGQLVLSEEEISPESVMELLRFLYSGNVEENMEVCLDLFAAGEKYDIGELKDQCESYLAENVSAEKAIEMHELAELYKGTVLKEAAFAVLEKHKAEIFSEPDSHKDFLAKFPELAPKSGKRKRTCSPAKQRGNDEDVGLVQGMNTRIQAGNTV